MKLTDTDRSTGQLFVCIAQAPVSAPSALNAQQSLHPTCWPGGGKNLSQLMLVFCKSGTLLKGKFETKFDESQTLGGAHIAVSDMFLASQSTIIPSSATLNLAFRTGGAREPPGESLGNESPSPKNVLEKYDEL